MEDGEVVGLTPTIATRSIWLVKPAGWSFAYSWAIFKPIGCGLRVKEVWTVELGRVRLEKNNKLLRRFELLLCLA
jgi:hypothetical protein